MSERVRARESAILQLIRLVEAMEQIVLEGRLPPLTMWGRARTLANAIVKQRADVPRR